MKRTRISVLYAVAITVACPSCDAIQPAPDNGSDMWTPEQVREHNNEQRVCVSCDAPFRLQAERKIQVA